MSAAILYRILFTRQAQQLQTLHRAHNSLYGSKPILPSFGIPKSSNSRMSFVWDTEKQPLYRHELNLASNYRHVSQRNNTSIVFVQCLFEWKVHKIELLSLWTWLSVLLVLDILHSLWSYSIILSNPQLQQSISKLAPSSTNLQDMDDEEEACRNLLQHFGIRYDNRIFNIIRDSFELALSSASSHGGRVV